VIKIVHPGQVFGIEEIINLRRIRMIRAKVIKTALLFIATKNQVLLHMEKSDVRQYIEYCKQYTDFAQQGVQLGQQIKELKRKTDCILQATLINEQMLKQMNFRS
jgi:hypothetical protein